MSLIKLPENLRAQLGGIMALIPQIRQPDCNVISSLRTKWVKVVWPSFTGNSIHLSQNRISLRFSKVSRLTFSTVAGSESNCIKLNAPTGPKISWKKKFLWRGETIGTTMNPSVRVFNGVIIARQEQGHNVPLELQWPQGFFSADERLTLTADDLCTRWKSGQTNTHEASLPPDYWQGFFVNLCILLLRFGKCPWSKGCKSLGTVPHHVAQNCSNAFRECITSKP